MPILERTTIAEYPDWLQRAQAHGAFVLIDKPYGCTSFDVVAFVRSQARLRRVGHAGTLDPLATGLLVLGIGKATKALPAFQQMSKTYVATLKLGAVTETGDAEAPEHLFSSEVTITEEQLQHVLQRFRGVIEQIPPPFAAVKYCGQRSYHLARAGILVPPKPRTVLIAELELLQVVLPYIRLRLVCSTGTYVRALARDIGIALGCGAYIVELRRTAIGNYRVEDALSPEEFAHCAAYHAGVYPSI
ncbi:MAG: tRNA pseudouridine(55) synthase TruB [Bacteroidota bacterium]|nr:tRNA pseudouridine(55) synthase TruB [Bacteroidota bacterium]